MRSVRKTLRRALPACLLAGGIGAASASVSELSITEEAGATRIALALEGAEPRDVFVLRSPDRLVVDLAGGAQVPEARLAVSGGMVRGVRQGRQADGRVRLVFDLDRAPFANPVSSHQDRRLLIALADSADAGTGVGPVADPPVGSEEPSSSAQAGSGGGATGFTFGTGREDSPQVGQTPAVETGSAWRFRLERGLVETGFLGSSGRPADSSHHLQGVVSASRALGERWELRLGARVDGHHQRGDTRVSTLRGTYDENWLRYHGDDWRLTAGMQKVIWGRTDEIAPTDRLSRKDLTRFGLDEMADRRRATPALRLEWFRDEWTVDALWLPSFRAATLPERDSIWHPVDRRAGRLLGLPSDPAVAPLVQRGGFDEDVSGSGGGGIRVSRATRGLDYAFTVQRARHSAPYYRMDEAVRRTLLATGDPEAALAAADGDVFSARHPRTWVLGGDVGFVTGAWTWRFEGAWMSDVPVTRRDLSFDTVRGFDWVASAETFPGDRDMRLTLQLAGMHLLDAGDVIDRRHRYYLNGEIEDTLAANRVRARMRFSFGLDRRDVYLNPEIAWIAWEPHELYAGLHWLDGRADTLGGFYRDRRMFVLGWRGRF